MRILVRPVLWWAVNAVALWVTAAIITGIAVGSPRDLVWAALIFGLVNGLLGPILRLLTCPLRVATLGLFSLVVNMILFLLAARISRRFGLSITVGGFLPALLGSIVFSILVYVGRFVGGRIVKK